MNEDVPLAAVLQVRGFSGLVESGVFSPSSGTRLHVVDFSDGPWSLNASAIYLHLTGNGSLKGLMSLSDPDDEAVHDYTITDPHVVRAAVELPRTEGERRR